MFMESSYDNFLKDAPFKIKKQMIPCILAMVEHLDKAMQVKVLDTFAVFT